MSLESTVYLVDDDDAVRGALELLLGTVGLRVRSFPDGPALLRGLPQDALGCLLLDIRMPHLSGLQLQAQLLAQGTDLPVIVMTGHGNVELCRRAFRQGASDFLEKPIDETALLEAVQRATARHLRQRERLAVSAESRARLERLTAREREVLSGIVAGQTAKQIARSLDISARTVETHRASVFAKLEADSLAELMRRYLAVIEETPKTP